MKLYIGNQAGERIDDLPGEVPLRIVVYDILNQLYLLKNWGKEGGTTHQKFPYSYFQLHT